MIMEKLKFNVVVVIFLATFIGTSCVPVVQEGVTTKNADCEDGKSFNPVARKCELGAQVTDKVRPSTKSIFIAEDEEEKEYFLDYISPTNSLALDCTIKTISPEINNGNLFAPNCNCVGGRCSVKLKPISNFNGESGLVYSVTDPDSESANFAVRVIVSPVNDPPSFNSSLLSFMTNEDTPYNGSLLPFVFDIDSTSFTFELLSVPDQGGNISLNTSSGNFTYTPRQDFFGEELFKVRVLDDKGGFSEETTISLNVLGIDDIPVGVNTQVSIIEDTIKQIDLNFTDADGDLPLGGVAGCTISNTVNVTIVEDCTCSLSTCSVSVKPVANYYTSFSTENIPIAGKVASFDYIINTSKGSSPSSKVSIDISQVNDIPVPAPVTVIGPESLSAQALPFDFTLPLALDLDDHDNQNNDFTYEIVDLPTQGTLSNCLNLEGSTGTSDLSCTYTPKDGNSTKEASELVKAFTTIQQIKFESVERGKIFEKLKVLFKNTIVANEEEYVNVVGETIEIHIRSNTTLRSKIRDVVNNHPIASKLIMASLTGNDATVLSFSTAVSLEGADSEYDSFTYKTNDGNNNGLGGLDPYGSSDSLSPHGLVSINVTPRNDPPTICEFSTFNDAQECGLLGCFGEGDPLGIKDSAKKIIPSKDGLVYYDVDTSLCWKSVSGSWQVTNSFIADKAINEKDIVVIDSLVLDEGGGDPAEDIENVFITSIKSTDSDLIPVENIRFFYKGNEVVKGSDVDGDGKLDYSIEGGDPSSSTDLFAVIMEIIPQGGLSGESTITIDLKDSTAISEESENKTSVTFKIRVNNVSARHLGWRNVRAQGNKVNRFGIIVNDQPLTTCSYSETKCNSKNKCIGNSSPLGVVGPDEVNAIYWDSLNKKCYRATSTSNMSWEEFDIKCNVSQSDITSECKSIDSNGNGLNEVSASCVFNELTADDLSELVPTNANNFYYDKTNKVCYRSRSINQGDIEAYKGTSEITIEWENFELNGNGTITGYNIYRRVSGEPFDYDFPINRNIVSSSLNSYVDNGENSRQAPVPKTVYYYEVWPLIRPANLSESIPTDSSEIFKTLRVVAPPDNMTFVHRWIVNKYTCNLMQLGNLIDPAENFSCQYFGPGETFGPNVAIESGRYDLGSDLLVDTYEASCPYSETPNCDTLDGSCIGIIPPTGFVNGVQNSIYYDRGKGECYYNSDGGNNWIKIDGNNGPNVIADHRLAHSPLLVNFNQSEAADFCKSPTRTINGIYGLTTSQVSQLPSRKYQVAYSQWDENLSDTEIQNFELGLSLNASPKCNTSSASGIEFNYSDVPVPDSESFFSVTGSKTSNIRSVMSGSGKTSKCSSRFGVQDAVGNVQEWVFDRILCPDFGFCEGVTEKDVDLNTWEFWYDFVFESLPRETTAFFLGPTNLGQDFLTSPTDPSTIITNHNNRNDATGFMVYRTDGIRGPCNDTNGDDICDGSMTGWDLQDQTYGAGRFNIPLGLPINIDFTRSVATNSNTVTSEIGPSSGITATQLRGDRVSFNTAEIYAEKDSCGAMATGGDYTDGNKAGVWNFNFYPCSDTFHYYLNLGQAAFKSKTPNNSFSIIYITYEGSATDNINDCTASGTSACFKVFGNSIRVVVPARIVNFEAVGISENYLYKNLVADMNSNASVSNILTAVISGNGNQQVEALGVTVDAGIPEKIDFPSENVKIGFRCMAPIYESSFAED